MALINCPECNKEISDQSENCINCGYKLPKQEPKFQGIYCPKCLKVGYKTSIIMCPLCHVEFKDSLYGTHREVYDYTESHPELKQSPEFSEEAYQRRINYVPYNYSNSSSKCPTCSSTNIRKINGVERMVSTGFFGLASKKIGKSFKCNNCDYTW